MHEAGQNQDHTNQREREREEESREWGRLGEEGETEKRRRTTKWLWVVSFKEIYQSTTAHTNDISVLISYTFISKVSKRVEARVKHRGVGKEKKKLQTSWSREFHKTGTLGMKIYSPLIFVFCSSQTRSNLGLSFNNKFILTIKQI